MSQSDTPMQKEAGSMIKAAFTSTPSVRSYWLDELTASEGQTVPDGSDFILQKRDGSVVAHYRSNQNFEIVSQEECADRAKQHSMVWRCGKKVARSKATAPGNQKLVISGHRKPAGGPGVLGAYVQPKAVATRVNKIAARLAEAEYKNLQNLFEPMVKGLLQEVQSLRDAGSDCAAPVVGITPFTGKSVTRNYTTYSHQDPGDGKFSWIWWYHKVPQGGQLADPGFFHMACEKLPHESEGGLRFRPGNGSVLFINTQSVWHHTTAPASTADASEQDTVQPLKKQRTKASGGQSSSSSSSDKEELPTAADGIYGTALYFKPVVFKAYGAINKNVVKQHLYREKAKKKAARERKLAEDEEKAADSQQH